MPIVFVTLMNANVAAALFILAVFIYKGIYSEYAKNFVPAFAITGLVATTTGFYQTFTANMPGSWNIVMGEPSVLIGVLLLALAWSISRSYSFAPLAVYGLAAGIVAVTVGSRVINLGLGRDSLETGLAILIAGVPGILALPAAFWARSSPGASRIFQWLAIILLVIAAGMLAYASINGYWDHLEAYQDFVPIYNR